jgi:hypothetical protein
MGFNLAFKGLNEASELIKRQMAETGINQATDDRNRN